MLILLDELRVSWHVKPQRVGVNGVLSEQCSCSTGSPQGSVLSPLLHILHTAVMTANSVFSVVLSVRRLHMGLWLMVCVKKQNNGYDHWTFSEVFKGQLVLLVHSYKNFESVIDEQLIFGSSTKAILSKQQKLHFYPSDAYCFNCRQKLWLYFSLINTCKCLDFFAWCVK